MTEHAVVIAGGGPTGLMLAGELALARVDVAIVERRASQELTGSRGGGLPFRNLRGFVRTGRPDGADAGGRAGIGKSRRCDCRTACQPGADWLACRWSALTNHRGLRPAWNRRSLPVSGGGRAGGGIFPDSAGYQRLSHPPSLRSCAVAEPHRADTGRLGRRAVR